MENDTSTDAYAVVLADLRSKRDQIDGQVAEVALKDVGVSLAA